MINELQIISPKRIPRLLKIKITCDSPRKARKLKTDLSYYLIEMGVTRKRFKIEENILTGEIKADHDKEAQSLRYSLYTFTGKLGYRVSRGNVTRRVKIGVEKILK